ncbi:hypothetical protein [Pasteurella atlantica]|uniref:Uncharacterized protein n=2 Tax=Pasteurellaceae TaxID=712 RepID=A0ACC6HKL4_9PAST|nr:hypothetical protein [Pasteurella atlantica]MDP8051405.1 hypothetical protein [Pasteurella atlantica]MDP8098405.1 hypothetical protein [Pasteurella atlantica]MDP8104715.1 hypothetical protein [Pasteurella atlantica]MDP8106481.1 hypothetical protein [Pasteurella atlantica]MDP8116208.1 hypothetical protein [Pasteurella atlantica]
MKLNNKNLNQKWLDYNNARLTGNRKKASALLNSFITTLLQNDEEVIENFVHQICSIVLKNNTFLSTNSIEVASAEVRIQHPLFQKVLIPVFIKKYKENDPLYIRWIAQMEQFFYSDHKTTNYFLEAINIDSTLQDAVMFSRETNQYEETKCRYFETDYFLKKSFELKPDQEVLDLILKRMLRNIDYLTHELPYLLTDLDDFIKIINEFKYFSEQSNSKEKWKRQIEEWENIADNLKT